MTQAWISVWHRRVRRFLSRHVGARASVFRLADHWFGAESVYAGRFADYHDVDPSSPQDFIVCCDTNPPEPTDAFKRLRWGGQLIIASEDQQLLLVALRGYGAHEGFEIESGPESRRTSRLGLPGLAWVPGLGHQLHHAVLRKTALLEPGEDTDRFTFDVRLVRRAEFGNRWVVMKQVPRYRRVVTRLRSRFPDASQQTLLTRAEKLVKRVFPVFLTREAGFLQLINRDLPAEYRGRMPEALGFEKAADGTIMRLYMSWMRLGGEPLSHLAFAQQAAELLSVLHDRIGIIHLDLRLDNIVISGGKVCFLDFGSSVRVGENIDRSPLLKSLFDEMMNTSQIQRTMGRMRDAGRLTSDVLVAAHGKLDKGVDMFYLSLQISKPVMNPDLLPLIRYEPGSAAAKRIKMLTDAILRPTDPNRPHFISARDVHNGLRKVERKLRKEEAAAPATKTDAPSNTQ